MCALLDMQDKKRRTIDYNREVAFEHKPAPGFFDTTEEQTVTKDLQQVWGEAARGAQKHGPDFFFSGLLSFSNLPLPLFSSVGWKRGGGKGAAIERGREH